MVYTSRTVNRANTPTVIPAKAGIQSDYNQAVYMRPVSSVALPQDFDNLARNAGRPDGPLGIIDQLVSAAFL